MLGKQPRHRPADVVDAEGTEKSQKRCRFAGVDAVEQILGGLVGKTIERQQLRLCQVVEVRWVFDQLSVDQLLQRRVTKALDVERAYEVPQVLEHLGGAGWIDAAG